MTGDVGQHALAQCYLIQALNLALRAGDRYLAADILAQAGRLTAWIGENAPDGQDTATPALAAGLHGTEVRGFALLGDVRETRHAVQAAQRCYEWTDKKPWSGIIRSIKSWGAVFGNGAGQGDKHGKSPGGEVGDCFCSGDCSCITFPIDSEKVEVSLWSVAPGPYPKPRLFTCFPLAGQRHAIDQRNRTALLASSTRFLCAATHPHGHFEIIQQN